MSSVVGAKSMLIGAVASTLPPSTGRERALLGDRRRLFPASCRGLARARDRIRLRRATCLRGLVPPPGAIEAWRILWHDWES
ncbi:MAG: hypothetical protein JW751_04175 [Polyangiaceae bacterium]|nr:hypothetical protein [Polyangiaceae bacterium]